MSLTICSINVRGIGDDAKRREMFNWLRAKKFSIYMIQEAHCTENKSHVWRVEWGYQAIFSSCTSARAGVGILFNNNFNLKLLKTFSDPEGRFLIIDIEVDERKITLANIYAPNEDNPCFFMKVYDHLLDFNCEEVIIGGDFNLVLDIEKDKNGGQPKTHNNSLKIVKNISEQLDLTDIWRTINPDIHRFTWRQKNPKIQCRLDFFLVSQSLVTNVNKADIKPGYKTDHSLIIIELGLNQNQRGRGFWKLNTSHLRELDYINEVRTSIEETKAEYQDTVNPALYWEMIKLKVREKSLEFASVRKKRLKRREIEIEQKMIELYKITENFKTTTDQKTDAEEKLELCKNELQKIIEHQTKGAIIRAKSRWYNEGEKNTKYFLTLEKRHYKQGTINRLKTKNGATVTSDKEILNQCETFYKDLYSSKINTGNPLNDKDFLDEENTIILTKEDQQTCEGELTANECLESLKCMDQNKTPGTDGLPAEFYKTFWLDISEPLINALNYSYNLGHLSVTQKRGIIKLIPKKDTELYYIQNWRPLSLLNTDYKIAAKSIANRIKRVLPKLINPDQTGFMKGRFIGENIRLIDSLITYTASKNIPGLLFFLDFEKAFDTLEWSFIRKVLIRYGFGESLINWVNIFYNNIESCILNNGWISNYFSPERGVRQGCPLSPYLFILSVEILADAIRKNTDITGISINNNQIKISQYADDTTLILNGSEKSLTTAIRIIEKFSKISGLRLNNEKTKALWIGSNAGKQIKLCPEQPFKWIQNKIKTLGVWLSINQEENIRLNYEEKLEKIKSCLNNWKLRRLTLLGKITVIKSLAASQLVYILAPLKTNQKAIEEIDRLFYDFLWSGRGDKIKRNTMIRDYSEGGLKMLDIASFNKALKIVWIKKYLDKENYSKWKIFVDLELQNKGGAIFLTGNLNKKDLDNYYVFNDPFIKEIIEIWSDVNYERQITSKQQLQSQSLWHNSLIRIANRPVCYKKWINKGITKVKQIMDTPTHFLTHSAFQIRYDINLCPIIYLGIVSSIKSLTRTLQLGNTTNTKKDGNLMEEIINSPKPCKKVYKQIIAQKSLAAKETQFKWQTDISSLTEDTHIDWKEAYLLPFEVTKSTKLIEFQFKLLHKRLSTNSYLYKIKIKNSESCTFCKTQKEDITHLFWYCECAASLWYQIEIMIKQLNIVSNNFNLDIVTALGLRKNKSKGKFILSFCFLVVRYHIWRCRANETIPTFKTFLSQLERFYQLECSENKSLKKDFEAILPFLNQQILCNI